MKYDISKFSSKWNVIIPIIYLIYNNVDYIDSIQGLFAYLFRSILFNFYSSGTTGKLQIMKSLIYENNFKLTPEMFEGVDDMRITDAKIDDLLFAEKGSIAADNILYCLGINYIHRGYDYDQDHIHPDARFSRYKPLGMTDDDWLTARNCHNKLPNLQLLRSEENESKGDQDFDAYYISLNPTAKAKMKVEGFIPEPPKGISESKYYNISNYLQFYVDRKALLKDKLRKLLNGEN